MPKTYFAEISTELLLKYFNEGVSYRDIAAVFNCSDGTIINRVKKLGWSRPNPRQSPDISGRTFNLLTGVQFVKNDAFGKAMWLFRCACGNTIVTQRASVLRNLTTSCGCAKHAAISTGYKSISGAFWRKLERSALRRKYEFSVTMEQAWQIYEQQQGLCAMTGVPILLRTNNGKSREQTASPDRIDPNLGYTTENFQWVHKRVNRLRNILSKDELIFWARTIAQYTTTRKINAPDIDALSWD